MTKQHYLLVWLFVMGLFCVLTTAQADDGQADLDQAMDLKVKASTLDQLEEVASLCEQAIKKGLNADDEAFAVRLLTGSLYQRSRPQVQLLLQARPFPSELQARRKAVLADLRTIVKFDDKMGQAHLMIAQLEGIRGGDREAARKSIDRALELLKDDKNATAESLLVRGQLQEKEEDRIADFDRAVELSPENPRVWQARAFYFLTQGQVEKAVADFDSLLKRDENNLLARLAVAETLLKLNKIDEAMEHVNRVIKEKPNVVALKLRAQLWTVQHRFDAALEDIENALKLEPNDLELFLMRARLYHVEDRHALAKADVDRVLQAVPNFVPAIDLRSSIEATMGEFEQAVKDIRELLKRDPDNLGYKLQLAIYQNAAGNSQEAIEVFSDVLKADPGNGVAFRGRADAYLNIGDLKEAIADYEVAIKSAVDDSGILNNFAWVLATAPDDSLRNGKRAIELGLKACELTDYKQAHILSTLAAAYAETGDFTNAIKWSKKACEISDETIKDQLQQELKSYQQKQPWRERKDDTQQKPAPQKQDQQKQDQQKQDQQKSGADDPPGSADGTV